MGKTRKTPGLTKIGEIWHIDKRVRGRRLCESTGTSDLKEAERYLAKRIEEIRQETIYGVRSKRTFRQAATKYLNEGTKRSLARDAQDLMIVVPFIGHLPLENVHMDTLLPFIEARKNAGIKSSTVNRTLAVVRRILNLAARRWRDENGLTWLVTPPMLEMENWSDARPPYPLDWDEQVKLFRALPPHLARMALFKVNTGCRENEVISLRWEWEIQVPELDTSVFLIPADAYLIGRSGTGKVKNGENRLIALNRVARSVVDECRGINAEYVFTCKGQPVTRMYNTAWKRARNVVGLPSVRVHDLKHTFGRRLRAAGVPVETRKALLGHKNGDITTHYSGAEIAELIEAAERVCSGGVSRRSPELTVLKIGGMR